jgi:hypothetical protein
VASSSVRGSRPQVAWLRGPAFRGKLLSKPNRPGLAAEDHRHPAKDHRYTVMQLAAQGIRLVVTMAKLRTHSPAEERQFSQSPASAINPRSASAMA